MSVACPNCLCERCEAIRTLEALDGVIDVPHEWRTLSELHSIFEQWHGAIKEARMTQASWNHLWDRVSAAARGEDEQGVFIHFEGAKVRVRT